MPPSPDEAGRAETRERADEPAVDEDRMDINVVDGDKPDTDLSNLIATLHRDEKLEVENANREILAVVRSLGGTVGSTSAREPNH